MAAANLNSKLDSSVPTMLGIIVDCNPIAWATSAVEAPIPFVQAIEHILVFINTFLIMNRHNRLVVIGSCLGERYSKVALIRKKKKKEKKEGNENIRNISVSIEGGCADWT
jgi:hypothetical protein